MDRLLDNAIALAPMITISVVIVGLLLMMNWILLGRHPELGNEKKLPRQLTLLGLTLVGFVIITFMLPVSDAARNQVIGLLGILLSGILAFSSTTFVANFMAGIMLRINRPFNTGDFIRVEEHFGRVSERGLFDTEIQSEHRELIMLPNLYLISRPVVVISKSGAIISSTLSLGYDIHYSRIEALLIDAALAIELKEPFVQVIELGNDAVTYRVSGLLVDVKNMLSTRSMLHRAILDVLHNDAVEIVSPRFVNQRRLDEHVKIIPEVVAKSNIITTSKPEDMLFDKAEKAEQQEASEDNLLNELHALNEQLSTASADEKTKIETHIQQKRQRLDHISEQKEKEKH
ncbi:mechanosensitive ion channel family protein [Neptunomonas antarctica]|uniref:Small-conductance mechanosensitive channel n=1 Tax=Neptunomonas antarctica TaxID=619304 RepID=A0A1N7L3P3_9GAMM|nr:mechanosensitive ion channel domain-containing protein [Neptunomonas antarctica]SIS68495.1 Mechanosensitive ion channel [Neptunomonas antarctica]